MTNAFGVVLDSASVRWAAAEGVPETVIAAVLLLEEWGIGGGIDEIVAKLGPGELEQVIKLVGRSPRCHPPGTLDALKGRRQTPAAEPVASISTGREAPARPAARIKPRAEDMRRAHERRLARLRTRAPQTISEPKHAITPLRVHAPQTVSEPERAITPHAPHSASERALRAHAPQSAFEPERAIERATPFQGLLQHYRPEAAAPSPTSDVCFQGVKLP